MANAWFFECAVDSAVAVVGIRTPADLGMTGVEPLSDVADALIAALQAGAPPWQPWTADTVSLWALTGAPSGVRPSGPADHVQSLPGV